MKSQFSSRQFKVHRWNSFSTNRTNRCIACCAEPGTLAYDQGLHFSQAAASIDEIPSELLCVRRQADGGNRSGRSDAALRVRTKPWKCPPCAVCEIWRPRSSKTTTQPQWSLRQGLRFLGGRDYVIALAIGDYLWFAWPELVNNDAVRREAESLYPADSFLRVQSLAPALPSLASDRAKNAPHLAICSKVLSQFEDAGDRLDLAGSARDKQRR